MVPRYRVFSLLVLCCVITALAGSQTSKNEPTPAGQANPQMSRDEVTGIIAAYRKIVSPNGVEELLPLSINGSTQWISIRGRDRRNPVLLFLHGGPGSPTMPADYTFQGPWEDYFTVVQWDQRGTGKTYAANNPAVLASTMTEEQMLSDAEQIVRYLRKKFGKERIFLLGHSWGTVLGIALAQRHPEWYHAYVGVGQMVNTKKSEQEGYEFALAQARSHHNTAAEQDLLAIAPYASDAGDIPLNKINVQRKWLTYYGGLTYGRTDFAYEANAWTLSPDYSGKELDAIDDGSGYSLSHLLPAFETLNYENVVKFECPIFLFQGRHDYTTSYRVAEDWFQRVNAPYKKLVWFQNSAHMPMQEEPGRFLYRLVNDVRSIAVKAGDDPAEGD